MDGWMCVVWACIVWMDDECEQNAPNQSMLLVCQRSTMLCTIIYNTYRQWHPCARPSRVVPADGWERFRRYRRDSSCLTSRSQFYVVEWNRKWKRKTKQTETKELGKKKIETHNTNTDGVHNEERAQRVAWRIPMTDDDVVVQVERRTHSKWTCRTRFRCTASSPTTRWRRPTNRHPPQT